MGFQEDLTRIQAAVQAAVQAIGVAVQKLNDQAAQIAALKGQVDSLTAQLAAVPAPVDTSALEAVAGQLEQAVASVPTA